MLTNNIIARNVKEPTVTPMAGSAESVFGKNLLSVAVTKFSHFTYIINLYNFCNLNVIHKDNAAINCIPVNFDRSHYLSPSIHCIQININEELQMLSKQVSIKKLAQYEVSHYIKHRNFKNSEKLRKS